MPRGCAFRARCGHADAACDAAPDIAVPVQARAIRCHHPLLEAAI
jgi:peptide/nickel transport system ATP-binding protein